YSADPLEKRHRLANVIEQTEAQDDVEAADVPAHRIEEVGATEVVTRLSHPLRLENKLSLIDMHLAAVDSKDESAAAFDGAQRPESCVAAEVDNALPCKRASAQINERLEKIAIPLTVAVHMTRIENGREVTTEVKLIMPAGKALDPFL